MKKYNIDPFMEKVLSDEYYKLRSSRDFYTGTSFKMSTWDLNTRYFNDENIIDLKGAYCILNPSLYQLNANKESTSITQKTATV